MGKEWTISSERSGPKESDIAVEHHRDARMGSPLSRAQNAVTIRCSKFYGTLGPPYNWKSNDYPYVQLTHALPEGREDLQTKLAEELKAFVDRFIAENDLEPK